VFAFLRNWRATLIPAVAVPVSIIGTFGAMYLLGYSLDNLSLMALTVATGFVVDDAIVVLENISRHMEEGVGRLQAALLGAREVGFTVLSISLSLVAVFLPILLMGGIVGRLFREFAVTLSLAILVSLVISLTTTPMMCALFLRARQMRAKEEKQAAKSTRLMRFYARTLAWSLRHGGLVMLTLLGVLALNVYLYVVIPKGFFPQQDNGQLIGSMQGDQSISFQAMSAKLTQMMAIVQADPAVTSVVGFTGGGGGGGPGGATNAATVFVTLKPLSERNVSVYQVIDRLRGKLSQMPGAQLYLQASQDIRVGGRQTNAQFQFTLEGDNSAELYQFAPRLVEALQHDPNVSDVSTDQQQGGLETDLVIDRDTAARLGITPAQIDNTLYDAFGQRQVSTIYKALNQYHVVMEVAPRFWQSPEILNDVYVSTSGGSASGTQTSNAPAGTVAASGSTGASSTTSGTGSSGRSGSTSATVGGSATGGSAGSGTGGSSAAASAARNAAQNAIANTGKGSTSSGSPVSTSVETMIPLAAISHFGPGHTPLAVNHQGQFVAATISFNLAPGKSLSDAQAAFSSAMARLHAPSSIHGTFAGTARVFQESLASEPLLIATALAAVYAVLGILYESYVHPITILSTLPSAGVGALLALMLCGTEFSIIALIGVILLIGIVKKNAILMIDFALDAERERGLDSRSAIFEASLLRFRPIMMTTMAALLGALPLALSFGAGGEIRRPLGIAIVGGLIVSQALTLYTTPVLYLYLDRFRLWARQRWRRALPGLATGEAPGAAE
ncbi:MAG: efflux RND transporter permease subunit, partial [Acetobacteraceae bacterium]|nr:efflux RND transporter permease subunit [Acetobacteraceae bacterium]